MKNALIILYGLPRTFKITSDDLFTNIIIPNMSDYNIEIIINTDFTGKGLTSNRDDTINGFSKYNYSSYDELEKDLNKYYNRYNQLKRIYNFNFTLDFCNPWFLMAKRIEMVLQDLYQNDKKYDIYLCLRMDIIIDKCIYLKNVNNSLLFITGYFIRDAFLHNRDMIDIFIGSYKPFMIFVQSFINIATTIVSNKSEFNDFFLSKPICDSNLISYLDNLPSDIYLDDTDEIVSTKLGLINSTYDCRDNYCFSGNQDLFDYYNFTSQCFRKQLLYIFKEILKSDCIQLSESINTHYKIIR